MRNGAIKINRFHRWYHQTFERKSHKRIYEKLVRGILDWNADHNVITPPCKNQGVNDSCGGESASNAIYIERHRRGIVEGELSAKSYYSPIADIGGGTTVPQLITQICTKGGNLEKDVPSYDAQGNPLSELAMENKSWMTDSLTADALTRAGYTPVNVAIDINSCAEAIDTYGFIIWEIEGQNGHEPSWRSATPQPPTPDNPNEIFRHFMVGFDYVMYHGEPMIKTMESEGVTWGDNGCQYFGVDYFNSGHIVDIFSAIHDSQLQAISGNTIWGAINLFFRRLWGMGYGLQLEKAAITQ